VKFVEFKNLDGKSNNVCEERSVKFKGKKSGIQSAYTEKTFPEDGFGNRISTF